MSSDRIRFVDDLLPTFDVESSHEITVAAPAPTVFDAARELDLSSSWIIRTLFRLRGMPASALDARGLARIRFKPLAESRPEAFILGIVGQFWSLKGRLLDFDPTDFAEFEVDGYAKAIWAFEVRDSTSSTTRLRTVTRVRCCDPVSLRRFRWYWKVIGPFSGIVRSEALKAIKRTAEANYPKGGGRGAG